MYCSKGTYIRSLIHDLGQKLGTGAVTTHIRRVQSGKFNLASAMDLSDLLASNHPEEGIATNLQPISMAVDHLPQVLVPLSYLPLIMHGTGLHSLQWKEISPIQAILDGEVLMCDETKKVLGLGHASLEKGLEVR